MSMNKTAKASQRLHRERGQLNERSHLGQLEKKKDYKVRAKDYQEKRARLKHLHKRALEKNPDEFYFHMVRSKVQEGEHVDFAEETETPEQRLLMCNQNLRYLQYKLNLERKKIEKLRAELQLIEGGQGTSSGAPQNTHIVFVDGKAEAKRFDPASYFNTHPALLGRKYNRPRVADLQTCDFDDSQIDKKSLREKQRKMSELAKRIEREKEIAVAVDKLTVQRNLQKAKKEEDPQKVTDASAESAAVYKFKFVRKR